NREYTDPRQRQLFKNIIYVGALSALIDMDVPEIEKLIAEQYKGKEKLFDANKHALHLGRDWVMMNLDCPIGLRLTRANAVGARAFTATSGPGISLMQEFLGLAYFAEIPAVIFDVQRAGPSTGMPTRTQQTDILSCAYASHGDTKHVLLFPEDPAEAFEFGAAAFDLADRLQTPVFVMIDLDIGM